MKSASFCGGSPGRGAVNATYLFSREMYQNLAKHLKPDGVVSV
jgi:spermidine synthase